MRWKTSLGLLRGVLQGLVSPAVELKQALEHSQPKDGVDSATCTPPPLLPHSWPSRRRHWASPGVGMGLSKGEHSTSHSPLGFWVPLARP